MKLTKQKAFILAFISTLSLILILGENVKTSPKVKVINETNIEDIKAVEFNKDVISSPVSAPIKSIKVSKLEEIKIPKSQKENEIIVAQINKVTEAQKLIENTVINNKAAKSSKNILLQDIPEAILKTPIIPLQWETTSVNEETKIALNENKNDLFEVENNLDDGQLAFNETEVNYEKLYPNGIENSNVTKAVKLKMKDDPLKIEKWEQMKNVENSSPWVVAESKAKTKNSFLNKKENNSDTQVAKAEYEDIDNDVFEQLEQTQQIKKNILIPLPEDLKESSGSLPMLDSKPSKTKKAQKRNKNNSEENETAIESIFDGIGSIFDTNDKVDKKVKRKKRKKISFFGKNSQDESSSRILPTEIRLSFQPNRAVISGQTLRWIHAFANKVKAEPNTAIEIRIDGSSSAELQQKRLNLINNIFKNKNVNPYQIKIVFTKRQANTLILRTIKIANETNKPVANNNLYYQNRSNYQQW